MTNRTTGHQVTVVIGAQWGDEGKGKITDYFAEDCDYIVRFQGGDNAGHTVMVGKEVYKLHLIPSGVLYSKPISVIGNGVVVNPKTLLKEIDSLKKRGIDPKLKISERAHVIMPYHIAMDEGLTGHQGKLAAGSTKRGIAPVYADKMYRHGIRMGDLLEPVIFKEKLNKAYHFNKAVIEHVFHMKFGITIEEIYSEYLAFGERFKQYICDTELELSLAYKAGKIFLFEAAQGMSLDVDHGLYPHTTSSTTIAGHINAGSGTGYNERRRIIGVVKAYLSRVGISPFPTEIEGDLANQLREKGDEYGTTTGRPRRVGYLDLVQIRQAVRVNGLTELALTKADILSGFPNLRVCTAYDIGGKEVMEMPASLSKMRVAKPVYKTLDGWNDINNDQVNYLCNKGYDALPDTMKQYIDFIEKEVDCPVTIISLGRERNQTILR